RLNTVAFVHEHTNHLSRHWRPDLCGALLPLLGMSKRCSKIAEIDHHLTTVEHHQITAILFCDHNFNRSIFPVQPVKSRLNGSGFEDVLPVADLHLDNI